MSDISKELLSLDNLTWIQSAKCVEDGELEWSDYFVQAGHSISEKALNSCKNCPVRRECLIWAYERNLGAGYFGGISHGTRKKLALNEALIKIGEEPVQAGEGTD